MAISKKKPTPKPTAWDDEPTPVPGSKTAWLPTSGAEPCPRCRFAVTPGHVHVCAPTPDAPVVVSRVPAKVAKLLERGNVTDLERLVIAKLALQEIAKHAPGIELRDIAKQALRVFG